MDNQEIQAILKTQIHKITPFVSIDCVILFGSRARNDNMRYSDIDLTIVGAFKEDFIHRSSIILENFDIKLIKLGIDTFCYTPNEFKMMFYEGIVSILDAIDHGICLFGQEFFLNYQKKLKYFKSRGLKRDPPVWIIPKEMVLKDDVWLLQSNQW